MVEESPKAEAAEHYDRWRAEDDLRTLTAAKQIEKDPGRMANVRRAAREKVAEMKAMEKYAKSGD